MLCSRLLLWRSAQRELQGRALGGEETGASSRRKRTRRRRTSTLRGLQSQGIEARLREEEYHEESRAVKAERRVRRERAFAKTASAQPSPAGEGGRRRGTSARPPGPVQAPPQTQTRKNLETAHKCDMRLDFADSWGVSCAQCPGAGVHEGERLCFACHRPPCGEEFTRWLVTSVDTDLWMIILVATSTGQIKAEGDDVVDVTVRKVVGGAVKYFWVNRVCGAICDLRDGGESA